MTDSVSSLQDDDGPSEVCLTCDKYFLIHQLHLHVESGECKLYVCVKSERTHNWY